MYLFNFARVNYKNNIIHGDARFRNVGWENLIERKKNRGKKKNDQAKKS